jgi:hypothetical protein
MSVTAENSLDLFIACEFSPACPFLDDPPFVFSEVLDIPMLLDLMNKSSDTLLVLWRPSQHLLKDFFELSSIHSSTLSAIECP